MPPDDLAERLAVVLGGGDVTAVRRLTGGASRETSAVTWRDPAGAVHELILQRQRPGSDRDMGAEVAALRAAYAAGVPVAEVVAASAGRVELGAPFMVLRRVEGETIARKILRDDEFADARRRLTRQFADALARLHAVDPDTVPGLAETDQVAQYRELLDLLAQPHPTFELVFRWLDANRPSATRRCLVHGDFRLGNVIVGPDGLRAVLDWELAHVGDPLEDLGWLCVKAWRFGSAPPVAGLGGYDQLLDAYRAASGVDVDAAAVRWWEVLGTLKWGIMCILQANVHLSGATRSHELAAIGRRVCENEHDLFLALEGVW
jgi:aminoglycoside phosphotransferase (APT) family kinase protein